MKKKLATLFAALGFCLLTTNFAAAQDQRIRLVKGRKIILKGEVSDRGDKTLIFRANKGQRLTIKLIGRDADFVLSGGTAGSVEEYTGETKFWSGKLPPSDDNEYYIRLISNYKVASYTIEIRLQ